MALVGQSEGDGMSLGRVLTEGELDVTRWSEHDWDCRLGKGTFYDYPSMRSDRFTFINVYITHRSISKFESSMDIQRFKHLPIL